MDLLVTTLSYTNETIWLQIKKFSATITPPTLEGQANWLPEVPIFVSSIKALIIFVIKPHTVQSRFSDILFSDNFAEDHFFST